MVGSGLGHLLFGVNLVSEIPLHHLLRFTYTDDGYRYGSKSLVSRSLVIRFGFEMIEHTCVFISCLVDCGM